MPYIPSGRSLKSLDDAMLRHDGSVVITGPLDFNYNEAKRLVLYKNQGLPAVRREGLIVFNQQTRTPWYYNGITWVELVCDGEGGGGGQQPGVSQYIGDMNILLAPISQKFTYRIIADPYESYFFTFKNFIAEESNDDLYFDSGEIGTFHPLDLKHKANGIITGRIPSNFRLGVILKTFRDSSESYTSHEYTHGINGVEIHHNLGVADHYVLVNTSLMYDTKFMPRISTAIPNYTADAGVYWVQLGANSDIVYNTGVKGLKFDYLATTENIVCNTLSLSKTGMNIFTHNSGTKSRVSTHTLVTRGPVNPSRIADVGDIVTLLGDTYDSILCSGNAFQDIQLQCMTVDAAIATSRNYEEPIIDNLDELLSKYATIKYVDDKLALKADKDDVYDKFATKVELQQGLDTKSDKDHRHFIADVNDLNDILNSKADKQEVIDALNMKADLSWVKTALDEKAEKYHSHNEYATKDEVASGLAAKANVNHNHDINVITGGREVIENITQMGSSVSVLIQDVADLKASQHNVTGGTADMIDKQSMLKSGDMYVVYMGDEGEEEIPPVVPTISINMIGVSVTTKSMMAPNEKATFTISGASASDMSVVTYDIINITNGVQFSKTMDINENELIEIIAPPLSRIGDLITCNFEIQAKSGESRSNVTVAKKVYVATTNFMITTSQQFTFPYNGIYTFYVVGGAGGTGITSGDGIAGAGGGGGGVVYSDVTVSANTTVDVTIGIGGGYKSNVSGNGSVGLGGSETKMTIGSMNYTAGGGGGGGLFIDDGTLSVDDAGGGGGGGGGSSGNGKDGEEVTNLDDYCGGNGGGVDGGLGGKANSAGSTGIGSSGGGKKAAYPGSCTLQFTTKGTYGDAVIDNSGIGQYGNPGCFYIELKSIIG